MFRMPGLVSVPLSPTRRGSSVASSQIVAFPDMRLPGCTLGQQQTMSERDMILHLPPAVAQAYAAMRGPQTDLPDNLLQYAQQVHNANPDPRYLG